MLTYNKIGRKVLVYIAKQNKQKYKVVQKRQMYSMPPTPDPKPGNDYLLFIAIVGSAWLFSRHCPKK